MNWEAIGAVGEVLGAIAVIITLLYLTTQVRQNTRSIHAQTVSQVASEMQRNLSLMASDDALATAMIKAREGQELSPLEEEKLRWWFRSLCRAIESHILQTGLGALPDDHMSPLVTILKILDNVPLLHEGLVGYIGTGTFRAWLDRHVLDSPDLGAGVDTTDT